MWERFSYYGMRALLVLYMVKYLLQPERRHRARRVEANVRGDVRAAWRAAVLLPHLRPMPAWSISPRVRRHARRPRARPAPHHPARRCADGHRPFHDGVRVAVPVRASTLLILGNGAFKPNMSAQVGGLYAPGDRRDRAYAIFYVGINIGAFLAPLVCGTLGEELGCMPTASPPPGSA